MCDICQKDDATVTVACLGFDCEKMLCVGCSLLEQVDLCRKCRKDQMTSEVAHPQVAHQVCCHSCSATHQFVANESYKNWTCNNCRSVHCEQCSIVRSCRVLPTDLNDALLCCPLHTFKCRNCAGRQSFVIYACSWKNCTTPTLVCYKEECGKFGNGLYLCNNHTARCHFCSAVAPLRKTGAPHRMYCLYPNRFKCKFTCCFEDLLTMNRLILLMRNNQFDFHIIAKILEFCRKESSSFDHRNKRIKI